MFKLTIQLPDRSIVVLMPEDISKETAECITQDIERLTEKIETAVKKAQAIRVQLGV